MMGIDFSLLDLLAIISAIIASIIIDQVSLIHLR